jgi:hypothetical protein
MQDDDHPTGAPSIGEEERRARELQRERENDPVWLRQEADAQRRRANERFIDELERTCRNMQPEVATALLRALRGEQLEQAAELLEQWPGAHAHVQSLLRVQRMEWTKAEKLERRADWIDAGRPMGNRPAATPPSAPKVPKDRPPRDSDEAIALAIERDEHPTIAAWTRYADEIARHANIDTEIVRVDEDPRWDALEALEAFRAERDAAEAEQMAGIRKLRADFATFTSDFRSVEEYQQFMLDKIVPAYNALGLPTRMCVECAKRFAVLDGRAKDSQHCSTECRKREEMRARPKVGKGLSGAARAVAQSSERMQQHWSSCPLCKRGDDCPTYHALFAGDEVARRSVGYDDSIARDDPGDD